MLAENLRTRSLSEAVERTFNGQYPCALCKKIAQGKQAEKESEFPPEARKFEHSFTATLFTFVAPAHFYEVRAADADRDALAHAPPVPPPKWFLI